MLGGMLAIIAALVLAQTIVFLAPYLALVIVLAALVFVGWRMLISADEPESLADADTAKSIKAKPEQIEPPR